MKFELNCCWCLKYIISQNFQRLNFLDLMLLLSTLMFFDEKFLDEKFLDLIRTSAFRASFQHSNPIKSDKPHIKFSTNSSYHILLYHWLKISSSFMKSNQSCSGSINLCFVDNILVKLVTTNFFPLFYKQNVEFN